MVVIIDFHSNSETEIRIELVSYCCRYSLPKLPTDSLGCSVACGAYVLVQKNVQKNYTHGCRHNSPPLPLLIPERLSNTLCSVTPALE